MIDVDDASLAEACGARVIYREDSVVVDEAHPLLEDLREIEDLRLPDPLTEDEDVIIRALNWATEAHVRFAEAQLKIAHGSSMGDAYASPELISPEMYSRFALPCEKKTVEALQAMQKPYSIHICGDTTGIIRDMGTTGADILEIDWSETRSGDREKRI